MERLSVEERIQGFKRFFAMNNTEGPLVGFFRETYYPLKRYRTESFLPDGKLSPPAVSPGVRASVSASRRNGRGFHLECRRLLGDSLGRSPGRLPRGCRSHHRIVQK